MLAEGNVSINTDDNIRQRGTASRYIRDCKIVADQYIVGLLDVPDKEGGRRNLGWLGGVFASIALGQLSTVVFLRVGKFKKITKVGYKML